MPRMSLAGSRPIGSSMRFTAKKMELPAPDRAPLSAVAAAICPSTQAAEGHPQPILSSALLHEQAGPTCLCPGKAQVGVPVCCAAVKCERGKCFRQVHAGQCAAGQQRVAARAVGQRAQDAQELQARVLLGELLQRAVAPQHVVPPLLARPRHQHLRACGPAWRTFFPVKIPCTELHRWVPAVTAPTLPRRQRPTGAPLERDKAKTAWYSE